MKAMGNGKEIKLNKDKSLLSHSGKAFNQEGVGILEVFIFSAATDAGFFFFSSSNVLLICILTHSVFWLLRFREGTTSN